MNAEGLKIAQRTAGRSRKDAVSTPSPFPKTPKQTKQTHARLPEICCLPSILNALFFFVVFSFSGAQCPPKAVVVRRHLHRFHHLVLFSFGGFLFRGRMPSILRRPKMTSQNAERTRPPSKSDVLILRILCRIHPHPLKRRRPASHTLATITSPSTPTRRRLIPLLPRNTLDMAEPLPLLL